ncbi:hypothetical protein D3C84_705310 [compost metagenome]
MPIEPGECRSARLLDTAPADIGMLCQVCRHRFAMLTQFVNPDKMPPPVRQPLVALDNGFDCTNRYGMTKGYLLSSHAHERLSPYPPLHLQADALCSVFNGLVVSQRKLLDETDTVSSLAGNLPHGGLFRQQP